MKKFTVASILLASSLFATSISLNQGWNLVGAVNGINPQSIGCAKTIWTYRNGGWNLYVKGSTSANNYGFPQISSINTGEGFWVNAENGGCSINFSDNGNGTPAISKGYFAYGLYLQDRKSDSRYTVSNALGTNSVVFDANSSTFTLSAYRDDNKDSRAGLVLSNDSNITSVQATLRLSTAGTDFWKNRAQLNAGGMVVSGDANLRATAGIVIQPNGVSVWYEIDKPDGTWNDEYYDDILQNTNMKGIDLNVRITLDGTKIIYSVMNAADSSQIVTSSYNTDVNASATIASGIRYIEVRARVKDNGGSNTHASDNTVVTLKDMKVTYAIPSAISNLTTPIDISSINHFAIMWPDDSNYMSFNGTNDSLSGKDYEFRGNQWVNDENMTITRNGNIVTLPDGEQIKFNVYNTRKINSIGGVTYNNLFISNVYEEVIVAGTTYDTYTWDWVNPTYYDPSSNQDVPMTDIDSLVAGFTTQQSDGGGNNLDGIFLNADGKVVMGQEDGTYSDGNKKFKRTDMVIGSWYEDGSKIFVDTKSKKYTVELVTNNGNIYIQVGELEKAGHISRDIFITGSDATDTNIQGFLATH